MKTKIFILLVLFIGAVFLFNLINEILLKEKIANIKYSYQEINDFIIVGKTDTDYYLEGKILKEFPERTEIKPFNLTYFKGEKPIFINSEIGIYFKDKSILNLLKNVSIKDKSINMLTESLNIYTDKNTAETDKDILILGKKMKTFGKGAFIDINKEEIKVFKVKSIFK